MKRDPKKMWIDKHSKAVSVKEFIPLFSWCRCIKCRQEFRREKMYSYISPIIITHDDDRGGEFNGCSECFTDVDNFVDYLVSKGMAYDKNFLEEYYGDTKVYSHGLFS